MQKPKLYILFFVIILFFLPIITKGAVLYLSSPSGDFHQNDTFIAEIRLDTEGKEINAIEADLNFSQDLLEVVDLSEGGSILSLWPQIPSFINSSGKINFIGGIPKGFQGQGLICKIIFRALSAGLASVNFNDSTKLLLNDGMGTQAQLTKRGTGYKILSTIREVPLNEWEEELKKDNIPPESFEVKLGKNEAIFGGKYFIVFSAQDEQSGIDHYEVKEGEGDWKVGESPYLLDDQELKDKILVKAVDKAGNEKISEITPPKKILAYLIIILILFGGGIIYWFIKRKRSAEK